jgi:hypothetical protein
MVRLLTLTLLSLTLFSCATRKVAITKSQVETRIDSVVTERKDSVSVQQNDISIKELIDELEIVPIDTAKPLIIDGKKYFNATIRIKKTNREVVDATKTVVAKSENKTTEVKKQEKRKEVDKKVEKKSLNLWWLWILLIIAAAIAVKRFVLK